MLQVNPDDAFGTMMMENLTIRGCPLLSILPDILAQQERLQSLGFPVVCIKSMHEMASLVERKRIEIIDEVEELNLLQEHYFFALATTDQGSRIVETVMNRNDNIC